MITKDEYEMSYKYSYLQSSCGMLLEIMSSRKRVSVLYSINSKTINFDSYIHIPKHAGLYRLMNLMTVIYLDLHEP